MRRGRAIGGTALAWTIGLVLFAASSCVPDLGAFVVTIEPIVPLEGEALLASVERDEERGELDWLWLRDGEPTDIVTAEVPRRDHRDRGTVVGLRPAARRRRARARGHR